MPPTSTRLLPLCIAFLLGATTTTTTTTIAAPAADAATNDILTTINLDEVLAKSQSALGPHYINAIWTTSSIEKRQSRRREPNRTQQRLLSRR